MNFIADLEKKLDNNREYGFEETISPNNGEISASQNISSYWSNVINEMIKRLNLDEDQLILLKNMKKYPNNSNLENYMLLNDILLNRDNIDISYYLSDKAIQGIKNKKEKSILNNSGFGAQYLDLNKPSYTIPARYWKDGYDALVKYSDTEIRRLTILELKRIQSFPDNYIIEGSKKDIIMQIGNAVACKFAYHLGKHLIKLLDNK